MEGSPSAPVLKQAAVYVIGGLVAVGALGSYAIHEHNSSQNLASQNEQLTSSLNATRSQIEAERSQIDELSAKVNSLASQPPPQEPSPALEKQYRALASNRRTSDARFKKLQSQVDDQSKAIDSTRSDLTATQGDLKTTQSDLANTRGDLANTRTELSGSIAHTHDELVLLEKKGERSYYEFDIAKSKQYARTGPFSVRLRKANVKHQYSDLELMVDDRSLSQKHVNLFQPVMYYTPDSSQPVEVVINSVSQDHIHGYVSAPKYRQSELASMQSANANANTATNGQAANTVAAAPQRQKLPTPQ